MNDVDAMQVMSALAQRTRLEVFRLLVDAQSDGMAAGDLATATGTAPNTMSAHLAILSRAGIVTSEKIGRTVLYRAATGPVRDAADFLTRACARAPGKDAGTAG